MLSILQLHDSISTRQCSLRLEPEDLGLPLRDLLNRYVKHAPVKQLLAESRITPSSAETLYSLGDMVYASDDNGRLRDMFAGIAFTDGGRPIGLNDAPKANMAQASGQEVAVVDIGIDRIACEYDRNWRGFHARRWRHAPERYASFVRDTLVADYGRRKRTM